MRPQGNPEDFFHESYARWRQEALEDVLDTYPELRELLRRNPDAIEISEQGDVYVHLGGAYPLIIKRAVTPWHESPHYVPLRSNS